MIASQLEEEKNKQKEEEAAEPAQEEPVAVPAPKSNGD